LGHSLAAVDQLEHELFIALPDITAS
jgi:hypothetical protein